jgi:hypothetical protein
MSQRGLPTTTGFAAREAIGMLLKHNIATAPLLLRAGLSEHGLARAADEGNSLPLRVSARLVARARGQSLTLPGRTRGRAAEDRMSRRQTLGRW